MPHTEEGSTDRRGEARITEGEVGAMGLKSGDATSHQMLEEAGSRVSSRAPRGSTAPLTLGY